MTKSNDRTQDGKGSHGRDGGGETLDLDCLWEDGPTDPLSQNYVKPAPGGPRREIKGRPMRFPKR